MAEISHFLHLFTDYEDGKHPANLGPSNGKYKAPTDRNCKDFIHSLGTLESEAHSNKKEANRECATASFLASEFSASAPMSALKNGREPKRSAHSTTNAVFAVLSFSFSNFHASIFQKPDNRITILSRHTAITTIFASLDAQTGKLHYALYANHNQSNADHMLPDFSYAGYGGGGVALPSYASIPVQRTLAPAAGDNRAAIQSAIDAVAAMPADSRGIRGAVELQAGEFEVSGPLAITTGGVILRGQGQGTGGTILKATTTTPQSTLISVAGQGGGRLPSSAAISAQTAISQDYVPVGTVSVEVADASSYVVGDAIAIVRTPNDTWVSASGGLDMAQYDWDPDSYELAVERTVTAVAGNTITFDAPITDTIEAQFGGGYIYKTDTSARLQQVGIENMRLQTLDYQDITREDRAFFAIDFEEVENSWVRDVTSQYFSQAFNFHDGSRFNTMQDIAFIDPDFEVVGGQHYAFDFKDAGQNFFQRCYSREGRHAFTSGSRATGPNVFLDCLAEDSTNDSGPHHRWATGTLFDNVKDSLLRVQNRTDSGSGHGWAGAQQLLWNSVLDEYVLQTPPFAMNWAVGTVGTRINGSFSPNEADGMIQNSGSHVPVRSLYLQQLEDRLGTQAVINISLPAQRTGPIWDELSAWAGQGKFAP